ncbi:helix-turn-helix domain-containing protein [Burkholderia diffusa]|uniref:helix-turn-helix domain-containing protein n=1 Tax=Burkholderia diffusa TaxID=488732 RepID=UPI0009BD121D|nr:helix-turn-helix transcriptional regulator [Burkholderia diffusa]
MSLLLIDNPQTTLGVFVNKPVTIDHVVVSEVVPEQRSAYPQSISIMEHAPRVSGRAEWLDEEFRQAYMEAAVEQGIAWQIRANRRGRDWSQADLARMLDTQQSAISRLEDPEVGGHTLDTLIKVAHAFDCALSVKLIPYSQLAYEADRLTNDSMYAKPFCDERKIFGDPA